MQSIGGACSDLAGSVTPGMPFSGYPVFLRSPHGRPVKTDRSSRRLPCPSRALTPRLPAAPSEEDPDRASTRTVNEASLDLAWHPLLPPTCAGFRIRNAAALLSIRCSSAHEALWTRPASRRIPHRPPKWLARRALPDTPSDRSRMTHPTLRSGRCHPPPGARSWRFHAFSGQLVVRAPRTGTEAPARNHPSTCRTARVCFIPGTLLSFTFRALLRPEIQARSRTRSSRAVGRFHPDDTVKRRQDEAAVGFEGLTPPDR